MLLVIDVGNTNTVIGIYNDKVLIGNWRIRTIGNITEDEFNVFISAFFERDRININKIKRSIVSCVVPSMVSIIYGFCSKYLGHEPNWVDAKSCKKISILIDNPDELGADRIVNSVAAYSKYNHSLIVVDFGTATTFDSISEKGEYLGGAISPGIMTASEALFSNASKLPRVDIFKKPNLAIGKNSIESMQSGIIFGYAGLVDGLVKRLVDEMEGQIPIVIATGGLAYLMIEVTNTIERIESTLTLEGLRILGSIS